MFPVAVVTGVAWLFVFLGLLAAPPSSRSRGGGAPTDGSAGPRAVVSLWARRLRQDGFGATLLDLAARGWFRLTPPGPTPSSTGPGPLGPAGTPGPAGPVMCVVPAEAPAERLAPYERRVVAHVAARAGARGTVPAPALSDGFEGGQTGFMKEFGEEVVADARERGLTRPRLSSGRIGLLCALLLVPAGSLLLALHHAHRGNALAYAGGFYLVMSWITMGVGSGRRCSAAGRAALDRWRAAAAAPGYGWPRADAGAAPVGDGPQAYAGAAAPGYGGPQAYAAAAAPGSDGRLVAYAAALGAAPAAVAVFAPPGPNLAWSSYRGGWQQIAIETNTWSCRSTVAAAAAVIGGLLLWAGMLIWLSSIGLSALAADLGGMTLFIGFTGLVGWMFRAQLFPRFTEFDGQVIRQWMVEGDDDGPDQYHLAIDDGERATAWDLMVEKALYQEATPGALVHARVSKWREGKVSVWLVEPKAVARQLADPGAPFDPRGPGGPGGTSAHG